MVGVYARPELTPFHRWMAGRPGSSSSLLITKGWPVLDENNNVIKAAVITGFFAIVATIIGALATHLFGLATPPPTPTQPQATISSSTTPAAAGGGSGANGSG